MSGRASSSAPLRRLRRGRLVGGASSPPSSSLPRLVAAAAETVVRSRSKISIVSYVIMLLILEALILKRNEGVNLLLASGLGQRFPGAGRESPPITPTTPPQHSLVRWQRRPTVPNRLIQRQQRWLLHLLPRGQQPDEGTLRLQTTGSVICQ